MATAAQIEAAQRSVNLFLTEAPNVASRLTRLCTTLLGSLLSGRSGYGHGSMLGPMEESLNHIATKYAAAQHNHSVAVQQAARTARMHTALWNFALGQLPGSFGSIASQFIGEVRVFGSAFQDAEEAVSQQALRDLVPTAGDVLSGAASGAAGELPSWSSLNPSTVVPDASSDDFAATSRQSLAKLRDAACVLGVLAAQLTELARQLHPLQQAMDDFFPSRTAEREAVRSGRTYTVWPNEWTDCANSLRQLMSRWVTLENRGNAVVAAALHALDQVRHCDRVWAQNELERFIWIMWTAQLSDPSVLDDDHIRGEMRYLGLLGRNGLLDTGLDQHIRPFAGLDRGDAIIAAGISASVTGTLLAQTRAREWSEIVRRALEGFRPLELHAHEDPASRPSESRAANPNRY